MQHESTSKLCRDDFDAKVTQTATPFRDSETRGGRPWEPRGRTTLLSANRVANALLAVCVGVGALVTGRAGVAATARGTAWPLVLDGVSVRAPRTVSSAPGAPHGVPATGAARAGGLPSPAAPLLVPSVNFARGSDACDAWIAVQNVGTEPGVPVAVFFGDVTLPPDFCAGPLKNECGGLLRPGNAWNFLGAQVPAGARSAVIYSFSDVDLATVPASAVSGETAAQYLCHTLYYEAVGDCADFAAFHDAYLNGGTWYGVPMEAAVGPPIVATVLRHCPSTTAAGQRASATYAAIPASQSPDAGGSGYTATIVGPFGWADVQNGGTEQALVDVLADLEGDGDPARCAQIDVLPGESKTVDLAACGSAGPASVTRFRSDQPVGVMAESFSGGNQMTATGLYDAWNEGQMAWDTDAAGWSAARAPIFVGAGPGITSTIAVNVVNLDQTDASASVRMRSAAGVLVSQVPISLCPGCGTYVEFSWPAGPGTGPVASLEVVQPGSEARLRASARVTNYQAGSATDAYASDLSSGRRADAPEGGRFVVPFVAADLDGTGTATELAVANFSSQASATVVVLAAESNDAVAAKCLRIPPLQTVRIVGSEMLRTGTLSAAEIHSVDWEGAPNAEDLEPLLGVAALVRTGTTPERNIPGDEVAVVSGVRIQWEPALAIPGAPVPPCQAPFAPAPRPDPEGNPDNASATAGRRYLPALDMQGRFATCQTDLAVRNAGPGPTRFVMAVWGATGFPPPQCAGPLAILCSPEIAADGVWRPTGLPNGMGSAIVYSVSPQTLDEAGIYPGSDTPLAEHLCELLTATAVGNCRDFQRFDLAYATGGTFGDIPLRVAYGQPVEVVAARECPKPGNPSETAAAVYAAVGGSRFDPTVTTGGAFVQSVVPTFAESDGAETRIYVQNGGQEATSVTLTARSFDGALQRVCGIFYIAPGESYPYLASDCLGPDFAGYTVVRSGEPLAVVADVIRPESFRTVAGRATANPFDLDGDGDVDNADAALVDGVLGAGPGDPTWDPRFDFNADGVIDEADLDLLLGQRTNVATPTATPTGPTPTATPSTVPTRPHRCPCQIFLPMAVRSVS